MSSPVEQIKERLDIVEVIGSYLKLEKVGQNYKAKCPFHNEKTASFMVSPSRQSFYCFGCQEGGDIFSFVERFEALDFKGALKTLADRVGIKIADWKPEQEERKDKFLDVMEKSVLFYEKKLKQESEEAKKVISYIEARGITEDSITKWSIGWAPDEWHSAHDYLLEKGFSREDMLQVGMIKKTEGQNKYYDTFRGRIMFPIFDTLGRPIAFSGRILEARDLPAGRQEAPKYLNSPENPLFHKSDVLYGLHLAKDAIRKHDYSVLVEGQIDIVMSHQAGIANTVASSGTALTDLHLKRLQKISNRVIIAYDSDEAGRHAARRAAELALALGMEAKIVRLPDGEDPASIIRKSAETWKEYLRQAFDPVELVVNDIIKEKLQGVRLAKRIHTEAVPLIAIIGNEMVKSEYISLVARKTGLSIDAIQTEVDKQTSQKLASKKEVSGPMPSKVLAQETPNLTPEEIFVSLLLWQESLGTLNEDLKNSKKKFDELLGPEYFQEIVENGNVGRLALIFEAERMFSGVDWRLSAEEILERIERRMLKQKFEKLANDLDKEKDQNKSSKIREEMKEMEGKISNLNK